MAITIPTVDEFTESTVMLVIREIAEYICGNNGLVVQINNNDITGFTSSYTNNVLKIDAIKGDGSTLPVCNVTIEGGSSTGNPYPTAVSGTVGVDGNITFTITMSSGSPITTTINMDYFASTADLSDLQEQVTGIKPTVTTNLESSPPTITVSVNGTSSTANLPTSTYVPTIIEYILDSNISTILTKINKYKGKFVFITSRGFRQDEGGSDNYNYLTFSGVISSANASSCTVLGCGFIARNDFNNRVNTDRVTFSQSYIEIDKKTSVGSGYSSGLSVDLYTLDISSIIIIG